MINFNNDYSEIAHKDILNALSKYKHEQNSGYGLDKHSKRATDLIKKHISFDVDIHFLIGGTSCNKIILSHILKPFEAVISVESGHINVSETGAIEASGHKILTTKGENGKVIPHEIIDILNNNTSEHNVIPRVVYISNSTEVGSIYTLDELRAISKVCQENNLLLFLDGARLGSALTCKANDLTLNDITNLTDIYYIGGTKNGAMFGEAVVIKNNELKANFRHSIKQNGGLLSKGFLIGIQFEVLFTNNLFFELAKKANLAAKALRDGLKDLGIKCIYDSPTNQLFINLDESISKELSKNFSFEVWDKNNNIDTIRLVTSWSTNQSSCQKFIDNLKQLLKTN